MKVKTNVQATSSVQPRVLPRVSPQASGERMAMIVLLLVFGAGSASAGGLTLGLEGPLSTLATALSSGIASWVIYIGIAAGALMWAIGSRNEDGMKRVGQVVVGGTVAIKALPFMTELGLFGATL